MLFPAASTHTHGADRPVADALILCLVSSDTNRPVRDELILRLVSVECARTLAHALEQNFLVPHFPTGLKSTPHLGQLTPTMYCIQTLQLLQQLSTAQSTE